MIYFDRIEVVNFLIQSAGELVPRDPAKCCHPELFVLLG